MATTKKSNDATSYGVKLIVIVLIKLYLGVWIDQYIIGCKKRWPYLKRPVLKL